ncbi:MAG TPA: hypothetical protein VJV75_10715, partial [Candidatus Polarisedimenticolia bacterium]|nr:hypothetical protein [Candidatus Polarisedimenticolia bacterium]
MGEPDRSTARGPLVAALLAFVAALPGVGLPFLSDDWALVGSLQSHVPLRTPFAYVRPVSTAWLWVELKLFGMSPAILHLTTAVMLALTAAVAVILLRRLTGDPRLAMLAGALFALHPYHIENAAWIAARPDVLSTLLALLSLWALETWYARGRGLPLYALALFEAALLAKESAVALPAMALVIALARTGVRPPAGRIARGVGALAGLALMHFAILWPRLAGRSPVDAFTISMRRMAGRAADFVFGTLAGAPTDVIESAPHYFLLASIVLVVLMIAGARAGERRVPAA